MDSGGLAPVYIAPMRASDCAGCSDAIVVANYHGPDDTTDQKGAGVASFHIGDDCSLTKGDSVPIDGHSIDPSRQGASHVHSVLLDAKGSNDSSARFFACDLGAGPLR